MIELETRSDDPVVLFAGDEPKWLGVPFTGKHGATTIKIASKIPRDEEELYKNRSRAVHYLQ